MSQDGEIGKLIGGKSGVRPIPKSFIRNLRINEGPLEGTYAVPCHCNRATNPEDPDVVLVFWFKNQQPMYAHLSCLGTTDA